MHAQSIVGIENVSAKSLDARCIQSQITTKTRL